MDFESITLAKLGADVHTLDSNMETDNVYKYESLPSPNFMRLLRIPPSANLHDPIICSMEIANPSTCGAYSALSYSWGMNDDGNSSLNRQIIIDGKVIPVTQNLYEGLLRLRAFANGLRIWIDAVCINQVDNAERSAQVSAMASRFADAAKVLVWLGEGDEEQNWFVRRAIDYLLDPERAEHPLPENTDGVVMQLFFHYRKLLLALNSFVGKRYFSRLWIVQELLQAPEESTVFFWGSCHLPHIRFALFASTWSKWAPYVWGYLKRWDELPQQMLDENLHGPRFAHIHGILGLKQIFQSNRYKVLPRLLIQCREMEFVEPLDRVYALVSSDPGFGILPDYTISVDTLFERVATKFVKMGWIEYIFNSHVGRSGSTDEDTDIQSWVPDLRYLQSDLRIDFSGLEVDVDDDGILNYNPFLLGTVIQCFDSEDSIHRRQRPCVVFVPGPMFSYPMRAGPMSFDDDRFSSAKVGDLICVLPTLDRGILIYIIRAVPYDPELHLWVSTLLTEDYRIRESMDVLRREMLYIV